MSVNNGKTTSKSSLRSTSLKAQAILTNSMESAEAFDVGDAKVQHYGLLMKKPFGHKGGRWQKRFVCTRAHTYGVHTPPKFSLPCPRRLAIRLSMM